MEYTTFNNLVLDMVHTLVEKVNRVVATRFTVDNVAASASSQAIRLELSGNNKIVVYNVDFFSRKSQV